MLLCKSRKWVTTQHYRSSLKALSKKNRNEEIGFRPKNMVLDHDIRSYQRVMKLFKVWLCASCKTGPTPGADHFFVTRKERKLIRLSLVRNGKPKYKHISNINNLWNNQDEKKLIKKWHFFCPEQITPSEEETIKNCLT